MTMLNKIKDFLLNIFGFRRNNKYIKQYLTDANIKSSIYMSFIVIILEIWMIFRQVKKYIRPNWNSNAFDSNFDLIFSYTSLYFLFIMSSAAMVIFAINYVRNSKSKTSFILNIVMGSLCVLWILLLIPEKIAGNSINKATTIMLYLAMPIFGFIIIGDTLYQKYTNKNPMIFSIVIVTCYAAICLLFGIKVGYSDFAHTPKVVDGVANIDKIKMITCFLTMVIFVACLLIWKPYISIIMLTTIFLIFDKFLQGYGLREFLEADRINYYTFLISLTMITISIYQQRVNEAKKDQELEYEAIYDMLVDIHNTKYLVETVDDNVKNDPNYLEDKKYLFINIVNFRTINDQKGFDEGDKFLCDFAKRLEKIFAFDIVTRQSDDHFVILTKNDNIENKVDVINSIVKEMSQGLFILTKIGGYKPKSNETPARSIDKARYACGVIKRKYGVVYQEYLDDMDKLFQKRQYIVNHLDEAISNDWIKAYYQPVVWSNDKKLCGAEALARWEDPKYGFLSPGDFIPVLEETRLIHKLDAHIVEYVCKKMRKAMDDNRNIVPVSINFSRLDFEFMDVLELLNEMTRKYNIEKKYLHVEVTESALSEDSDFLNKLLLNIKENGYAIWLDDFGSGYSSLNVLKDFDFDVIKIDMKFLSNFEHNKKSKDVIDCIITLAERLNMKTLTEGVETEEEANFLSEIGCGRLQGYLFGKPLALAEFEKRIEENVLEVAETKLYE